MPVRRATDPLKIQHIWDTIKLLNSAKQIVDLPRIIKSLQTTYKYTAAEAEQCILQSVQDGLVLCAPNSKGDNKQEVFSIPTQELPELDGKDWYCYECHLAGEVTSCAQCHRVFHPDCTSSAKKTFDRYKRSLWAARKEQEKNADSEIVGFDTQETTPEPTSGFKFDQALCCPCNIYRLDETCELEKDELNYLLTFVLNRIRSWLPENITHKMDNQQQVDNDAELAWRANQLFFEPKDMSIVEVNLENKSYNHYNEFLVDVLNVHHNVSVFHGSDSQEKEASEYMLRDTLHDLNEMRNCPDCYKYSNEKICSSWFSLPCRQAHEVVWAKQKGYPYWPAKVIKKTQTHFDVRFFGGKHERANLPKTLVKPITFPKEKLQLKQSMAFTKAMEEMDMYNKFLTDSNSLEEFKKSFKEPKKKSRKPKLGTSPQNLTNSGRSPPQRKRKVKVEADIPKKKTNTNSGLSMEKMAVINISDGEDDVDSSVKDNFTIGSSFDKYDQLEPVTSSTGGFRCQDASLDNSDVYEVDNFYSEEVDKMRKALDEITDRDELIKTAIDCMQKSMERIRQKQNEHIKQLNETHRIKISETKKKQWCFSCEKDAIYHCCWNTSYCSPMCQQQHWIAEHKKVCRRKR